MITRRIIFVDVDRSPKRLSACGSMALWRR
jgi:hypothetical protein